MGNYVRVSGRVWFNDFSVLFGRVWFLAWGWHFKSMEKILLLLLLVKHWRQLYYPWNSDIFSHTKFFLWGQISPPIQYSGHAWILLFLFLFFSRSLFPFVSLLPFLLWVNWYLYVLLYGGLNNWNHYLL